VHKLSGIVFWLGLLIFSVVAVLALTDNVVSEIVIGLMLSAERHFLAVACLCSAALIGASLIIRRKKGIELPKWRLSVFGLTLLCIVVLSIAAAFPGFATKDVAYISEGVEIRATIYMPEMSEPVPAIVLIPGSAPFPRRFYDAYASRLVKYGYAVLVADKRGAGESGGVFESNNNTSIENLRLLATDVIAGVDFIAKQPAVDPRRIGLFGISQAGWVSALVVSQTPDVKFLVLVTAPAVSVGEEGTWSDLRGDDESDPVTGLANAEEEITSTRPLGFDPRDYLKRQTIPSFWLFGDSDNSVPSQKSISVLESMPNERINIKLYSNYGHMLIGTGTGNLVNVAEQSWQDIKDWLDEVDSRY
jgi:hypothetical protein